MREFVYFSYCKTKRDRNVQLRDSTVSNRFSEPEHFWHVYTPVARGPVLKLTMIHRALPAK